MVNKDPRRAAVLGATGYTGQELVALLARHPRIRATFVSSESEAGQRAPGGGLQYVRADQVPLGEVDVVFTCLPHGEAGAWALEARAAGARVVDLSSDLRDGAHGAVYGLTELWREEVRAADLVANPGCYPTGVLLALRPLVEAGLLDVTRPVLIDAASGVTGAGRTAKRELLFGEVAEDYRAYGVGNTHRHVPEIVRGLGSTAAGEVPFVFTPHLLPVRRGILETMYVPVTASVSAAEVVSRWGMAYGGEPFVEVWQEGLPSLRTTVGRNTVALGASDIAGVDSMVLVVASLDNLVKGAAGQALQNANLMLGLCEHEGLPR
ncbi:MAG TPA: N-acetyl-gamma-glutamyl-phosphate reductase [Longimicrobiales bacterium]